MTAPNGAGGVNCTQSMNMSGPRVRGPAWPRRSTREIVRQPLVRVVDVGGERREDVGDPVALQPRRAAGRVRAHRHPGGQRGPAACSPARPATAQGTATPRASTTSLRVTPCACRAALTSSSESVAVAKLRREPSGPLNEVRGTSRIGRGGETSEPRRMPHQAEQRAARSGRAAPAGQKPARTASTQRAARAGRDGVRSSARAAGRPATAAPRSRWRAGCWPRAVGQAWWSLATTATRPPSSPSQTCSSHSGTDRSSGTLTIWPTSSSSSRMPPRRRQRRPGRCAGRGRSRGRRSTSGG